MPRPRKFKKVCTLPQIKEYGPIYNSHETECIIMSVEEYETIRLMDFEGLNQQQSSKLMGVARSAIQRLYDTARKKLADSLINGKTLKIQGGDYKLCSDIQNTDKCDTCICHRHRHGRN